MNDNVFMIRKKQGYFTNFKKSIGYSMKSLKCGLYFLINAFIPTNMLIRGENGIKELQYKIEDEKIAESQIIAYEEII